jgi:hypothetical protein
MTREEFMATTKIKSPEEAKQYLNKLNKAEILSLFLLFGGLISGIMFNNLDILPIYFSIIFIIPFFLYINKVQSLYTKIKNLLNITNHQNGKESIFPRQNEFQGSLDSSRIRKSLKIIIGANNPPKKFEEFTAQYKAPSISSIKNDKTFWKYIRMVLIVSVVFIIIGILIFL